MSRRIIFRCDGSPEMGGGHIMRCLTLAQALKKNGTAVSFIVNAEAVEMIPALNEEKTRSPDSEQEETDVLIVDHYGLDKTYESTWRGRAGKIVVLDDLADRNHDCDVLIDPTYDRNPDDYKSRVPKDCAVLTGAQYAVLRPEFAVLREKALLQVSETPTKILLSFGLSNIKHATEFALEALMNYQARPLEIDVVLGGKAAGLEAVKAMIDAVNKDGPHKVDLHIDTKDIAQKMAAADLAIGAGGTTSWERCCLGLPAIVIELADNQTFVARQLAEAGAIKFLGPIEDLSHQLLLETLTDLLDDPPVLKDMAGKAAAICDGRGADRIVPHLFDTQKAQEGMTINLRFMTMDDEDTIYAWQSDPKTRQYFRNADVPAPEEHHAWMKNKITDLNCYPYVIEAKGLAVGVLRLDHQSDKGPDVFEISILIASDLHRKGIAGAALALVREMCPQAVLTAEVLPGNEASRLLFEKAGYESTENNIYVSR